MLTWFCVCSDSISGAYNSDSCVCSPPTTGADTSGQASEQDNSLSGGVSGDKRPGETAAGNDSDELSEKQPLVFTHLQVAPFT